MLIDREFDKSKEFFSRRFDSRQLLGSVMVLVPGGGWLFSIGSGEECNIKAFVYANKEKRGKYGSGDDRERGCGMQK